jgi:hypothetical protein
VVSGMAMASGSPLRKRVSARANLQPAHRGRRRSSATPSARGCTNTERLVDCANRPGRPGILWRPALGLFDGRNRRHVAIAIRADGRRVQMPLNDTGLSDGSLLGLLRSLVVGLESLLGLLITGSRRENGGNRRNGR